MSQLKTCVLLAFTFGYGADAINPYLAFEALSQAREEGVLAPEWSDEKIVADRLYEVLSAKRESKPRPAFTKPTQKHHRTQNDQPSRHFKKQQSRKPHHK